MYLKKIQPIGIMTTHGIHPNNFPLILFDALTCYNLIAIWVQWGAKTLTTMRIDYT